MASAILLALPAAPEAQTRPQPAKAAKKSPPGRSATIAMTAATERTASAQWWQASASMRMAQTSALRRVREAGLRTKSSGHCTDPRRPWCTSLQSIRLGTLAQVIDLKQNSDCDIVITGGTETGHASGTYSHGNGYKVDIAHNACVDAYIPRHFRYYRVRGDGAPLYRSDTRDIYAKEPSHWDILYR